MAPPTISDEEIIEIQSLFDKGFNIPQIQEKTKKSTSIIDKYIHAERIQPKIPEVPKDEEPPEKKEDAKHVTLKAAEQPCPNCRRLIPADAKLCPYCGMATAKEEETLGLEPSLEPWDWFKKFLEQYGSRYGVKRPFIELQSDRVKMRNGELPTPTQLTKDLTTLQQSMKLDTAAYIAEIYSFQLNEYQARRQQLSEYWQQPYQGIQVPVSQQPRLPYQGIPVGQPQVPQPGVYPSVPNPYQGVTVPMLGQPQQQQYPPQYAPAPYPRLESELERYARIQQLFQKTEERNPVTDRLEKENDALAQRLQEMEASMKNQMIAENQQLRTQLQQQSQAMRQYEDNLREANLKLQFEQSNKRTTEEDVRMREVDHKYDVDIKKLDEGGKTREAIANAVKTGFSQVGQAIFATAQEIGSEEKRPMEGFTDTKNMWQSECPFCSTTITAPLSARMLTCPGCGKQLEVSPPTTERPQRAVEQPPVEPPVVQPPVVEQPPLQPPPVAEQPPPLPPVVPPMVTEQMTEPLRISECPFCKTPLTIPAGLDMVECPQCKKKLRVEAEVPTEVPIQVPKEIPVEIVTKPQPVKDQIIEQPIMPELTPEKKQPPDEFTSEEKEKIDRSLQDAKEGRITPLKIEEPIERFPKHKLESIKKLEEELKEEKPMELGKPLSEEAIKKSEEPHLVQSGESLEEELKKEKVEEAKKPFSKDGYILFKTTARSGTPFYYFGKTSKAGEPCFEIPEGRELGVNSKTGLPILRKKKE